MFKFESPLVGVASLHAVARRYQRGFDVSKKAILADLGTLACEVEAQGDDVEWQIAAADGRWVGVVASLTNAGRVDRTLLARTFIGR